MTLSSLRVLPADLTVDQLWPYLQQKSEKQINQESSSLPIAIVDRGGKFLGLLDSWHLLEFISTIEDLKLNISTPEKSSEMPQIVTKDLLDRENSKDIFLSLFINRAFRKVASTSNVTKQ